ncbi:maleylpyruvate isomerase N-terminal domain-containing protein [Actinokineospora spheciospongiae]|uniref:maleylpyruvate isomerase N-terminal domain-containing protein n=1 Tax=Actinokineospora spheciospongiae TaxID=909613 RepID=UPI000D90DABC|nr:maleylpyruvate isomerase N-terminal domain-containing protein [Actinokineospora spheciospongiae]PWW54272.1 mycothiol maleylpyruvate isomerase-like protein [Actinokineospora spheciospongiae]
MDGAILRSAVECCRDFLAGHTGGDWARPGEAVELSTGQLVAHVGETLLWYSADFLAGAAELSVAQVKLPPDGPPGELLRALDTYGRMLALLVDAAPPGLRGLHPFGSADASGFAAMAGDELLVHTGDAAAALGVDFAPPAELVTPVLERIFPWAPTGADPWRTLLWANGRTALPGHPRLDRWRWHCAPLDEWDGTMP